MRERTNNDLCTPEEVLALVWQLGPIALDPCSNPWSTVGAQFRLDGEQGRCGLLADWHELAEGGLVFVNPPYGRGHMRAWAAKIADEAARGCEILALVKGDHSTEWWRTLRKHTRAICYWDGRISFEGGSHGSGNFASSLLYFGPRPYLFCHVFQDAGDVRVMT